MSSPGTFDYFTLGIAAVGAVTGVAALAVTIFQFVLSAPRLRVIAKTGFLGAPVNQGGISVVVTNRGRTAANIDGVDVRLGPSGPHVSLAMELSSGRAAGKQLPFTLEPYATESWWISARYLMSAVHPPFDGREMVPYVTYAGKTVESRNTIDCVQIASLD